MEASNSGRGKEQTQPVAGTEKEIPAPAADAPKSPPEPDLTTDPAGSESSEEDASPEVMTPEQEAQQESEQHITELLKAYQPTRRPWTRSRIFPR